MWEKSSQISGQHTLGTVPHYSYKLYKEQENSTLSAIMYYAMLLFGPE